MDKARIIQAHIEPFLTFTGFFTTALNLSITTPFTAAHSLAKLHFVMVLWDLLVLQIFVEIQEDKSLYFHPLLHKRLGAGAAFCVVGKYMDVH